MKYNSFNSVDIVIIAVLIHEKTNIMLDILFFLYINKQALQINMRWFRFAITQTSLLKSINLKNCFLREFATNYGQPSCQVEKTFLQKVLLSFKKLTDTCFMNLLVVFLFGSFIDWHW